MRAQQFGVFFVAACLLACTQAYPDRRRQASDSSDSDERNVDTLLVLPSGTRNQMGGMIPDFSDSSDIDEDSMDGVFGPGYFNAFRTNVFDGFFTRMMQRLREQMAGILSTLPEQGIMPWGKVPEGANTTSTRKVIDGHVVTINETTYTDGDDEHGTVIRVRVIDIKPQNETIPATEATAEADVTTTVLPPGERNGENTTPARSVETVEDFDNEIPKSQDDTLTA